MACQTCRKKKVKCCFAAGSHACERCIRLGVKCMPRASQQGRRTDMETKGLSTIIERKDELSVGGVKVLASQPRRRISPRARDSSYHQSAMDTLDDRKFGDWANRNRHHRQLKSCQESDLTTYRVTPKKVQRRIRVDSAEASQGEDTLCVAVRTTASREKKRKTQTNAAAERIQIQIEPDVPTTKRRKRAAPAAGLLQEAEASAYEEEEVEEMRVPRSKAAKNPSAKRGEQVETITMKKSDYEDLLREKEKLQTRYDEIDKLLAPILEGNRKLKAMNTALKAKIKELKAKNKALSKKRK